jgi:hypothetical protein
MSNTLTNLQPDLYEALDVVSRELVGFIPSVTLDASVARAALNENVRSFATTAQVAEDVTPAQLPPDDGDQVVNNVVITISKSRAVPFRWTGEEQKGVNHGPGYRNIRRDQIAQAFRTLTNEIEVALGGLITSASRAYIPASGVFNSDLSDAAQLRKILSDNGAPLSDMQLVIDTTAGARLRSLAQLTKANEAGTTSLRAQGTLLEVSGFTIRESAGVAVHTNGTGSAYVTNGTQAKAATSIALQTGSGTVLAGDILNFATDTGDNYVVNTALSAGTLTINNPGLRQQIATGQAATIKSGATSGFYTGNLAFARTAMVLATRQPALPEEGDMAEDRMTVVDPRSGLAFEVAMYKQYRRVRYEIAIAYGFQMIKPEHAAILAG